VKHDEEIKSAKFKKRKKRKKKQLTVKETMEKMQYDFAGRGHSVIYIQDALRDFAPKLFDKIYDVANVNLYRWTKKPKEVNLGIKRIEYIKYEAGEEGNKIKCLFVNFPTSPMEKLTGFLCVNFTYFYQRFFLT
jgi:hypothetical protein